MHRECKHIIAGLARHSTVTRETDENMCLQWEVAWPPCDLPLARIDPAIAQHGSALDLTAGFMGAEVCPKSQDC